jgi:ankyrin repeat protein
MNFLLYKGAKADTRDARGNTPLMITAQIGFVEGAQLLISKHATVDLTNSAGETPLIRAVQNRNAAMVQMLLQAGANPKKADNGAGLSALDYATRDRRATAILKILQDAKATTAPKQSGPKL